MLSVLVRFLIAETEHATSTREERFICPGFSLKQAGSKDGRKADRNRRGETVSGRQKVTKQATKGLSQQFSAHFILFPGFQD